MIADSEQESLQGRINEFVSEFTGVKVEKLTLASRLNHEIGIDGDDAVEFFKKFAAKFSVDLEALYWHWDEHFVAEGVPISAALLMVAPPSLTGLILSETVRNVPTWAWFAASHALWWGAVFAWQRVWGPDEPAQVTIKDLVEAAATRRWVKYDGETLGT